MNIFRPITNGKSQLIVLLALLSLLSCSSPKKVIYFNDLSDEALKHIDTTSLSQAVNKFEAVIQKNDLLWIAVGGSNHEDLQGINSGSGTTSGGNIGAIGASGNNSILGYLVEADGTIKLPYLGKVMVEGLTRTQLETKLTELFSAYTKNPVVNVRFFNHTFSVIGEVNKAGRYSMQNERVTVLEALGMAGDLTILAKRENILLVREQNGKRTFARLNLLSKDLFNSPYFYLKNNDVLYVEPVSVKFINRTGLPQYLAIAASSLALVLSIITISKK